jgi:hypothetical protein
MSAPNPLALRLQHWFVLRGKAHFSGRDVAFSFVAARNATSRAARALRPVVFLPA